jgi:crossover junction endodeoxyribonuclease RuvC
MLIIGIDPGLLGGIAFLDLNRKILYAIRMPILKLKSKNKITSIYDIQTLVSLFLIKVDVMVTLEKVSTRPGQGIASNGKLMYGYGLLHGLIARYDHQTVIPRTWKKEFNLHADKELSRAKASELFPHCSNFWRFKNQDGVAEATLLALWGAKQHHIEITSEIKPLHTPWWCD